MSQRSGREKILTEKAAASYNDKSKQKQARTRESKGKSSGKKRRVSSSSSGESDMAIALNKAARTSKKSEKKSVKRLRKMVEEVVDEEVQDEGEDEVVEALSPSASVIDIESGSTDDAESADGESDGQKKKFKLRGRHHAIVPEKSVDAKKKKAADIRTIFSELCTVKFVYSDGNVESLRGHWCDICRSEYV